jgi:FtsH-binding integral membrane protein
MDLREITREQKMFGAAIAALLFILTLLLKWVSVGPVSASGTDFGAWWIAMLIALVGGGILAADALGVEIPVRLPVTSLATYLMSLLVFYVIIFIFAADSLSYGVWLALIFSVIALGLSYSLYRDDAR